MSKWLVPIAFLKWLVTGDRLEIATASDTLRMSEPTTHVGFWRWLLSSEELPVCDVAQPEVAPVGLLRFIFSAEELPRSLPAETTSKRPDSEETPGENEH